MRHLVDQQLRPLGLLTLANGAEPELRKQNPLLGLRFRYAVTDPDRTRRVTDPFRVLFRSFMVVPLLAAFAIPRRKRKTGSAGRRGARLAEPVPLAERSQWGRKLAAGEFVTTVEIVPPRGVDASKMIRDTPALNDT